MRTSGVDLQTVGSRVATVMYVRPAYTRAAMRSLPLRRWTSSVPYSARRALEPAVGPRLGGEVGGLRNARGLVGANGVACGGKGVARPACGGEAGAASDEAADASLKTPPATEKAILSERVEPWPAPVPVSVERSSSVSVCDAQRLS